MIMLCDDWYVDAHVVEVRFHGNEIVICRTPAIQKTCMLGSQTLHLKYILGVTCAVCQSVHPMSDIACDVHFAQP